MPTQLFRTGWMIAILGACISMQLRGQIQWHRAAITANPDADPFAITSNGYYFAADEWRLARSTDGGATWSDVLTPPDINRIIVEILIGPDDQIVVCSENRVHLSNNYGQSWIPLPEIPSDSGKILSAVFTESETIVVGTDKGKLMRLPANGIQWKTMLQNAPHVASDSMGVLFAVRRSTSIQYSTDDGEHWNTRGPQVAPFIASLYAYSDGKVIVSGNKKAYHSTDGGSSWREVGPTDPPDIGIERMIGHPSGALVAITTNKGLYHSPDGGATWMRSDSGGPVEEYGYPNLDARPPHLTVVKHTGDIISGGSGYGIVRSTDAGATWTPLNITLGNFAAYEIVHDQARGVLYAVARRTFREISFSSGVVLRSTDNGEHWEAVHSVVGDELVVGSDGYVAMTYWGRILGSWNQGASWGLAHPLSEGSVLYLAAAPNGMVAVEKTGQYYYRSNDGNKGWERRGSGPESRIVVNARGVIVALNGQRSTDTGKTWQSSTAPLYSFGYLVADPQGTLYGYSATTAYQSIDDGTTWTPMPAGYPANYYSRLSMGHDGTLFINDGTKVYSYNKSSGTWELHGDGPTNVPSSMALIVLPGSRYIAGGRGIFVGTIVTSAPARDLSAAGMAITGSTPHPASQMAEIHFSISTAGPVRLSLYDMTGRPVATLLDEYRTTGAQSAEFNAALLPSGVYICRLDAAGESVYSTFVVAH